MIKWTVEIGAKQYGPFACVTIATTWAENNYKSLGTNYCIRPVYPAFKE